MIWRHHADGSVIGSLTLEPYPYICVGGDKKINSTHRKPPTEQATLLRWVDQISISDTHNYLNPSGSNLIKIK